MNEVIVRPEFTGEIKAEIKTLGDVTHNLDIAYDYAVQLNEFYTNLVFTEDQVKDAKRNRADLNNMVKTVADYRKSVTKEFNKPIEDLVETAKKTEKLLEATSLLVDNQVKTFENKPLKGEQPVDAFTGEPIIEKKFKGTESQLALLTEYARSIGMEV